MRDDAVHISYTLFLHAFNILSCAISYAVPYILSMSNNQQKTKKKVLNWNENFNLVQSWVHAFRMALHSPPLLSIRKILILLFLSIQIECEKERERLSESENERAIQKKKKTMN